jgi:hypothetical protein
LPKLLHTTHQNFTIRQVSADAVYNTKRNQEEIAAIGAEAYPYPAKAGCTTVAGRRRTRAAPAGMTPAVSWS